MRVFLLVLILAALPMGAVAQSRPARPPSGVSAEYDRIRDQTLVRSELFGSQGSVQLEGEVFTILSGEGGGAAPDRAVLRFTLKPFMSAGWQLLDAPKEVFLLLSDGQRVALPGEYSSSIDNPRLVEVLDVVIDLESLRNLAMRDRVEGRVGSKEFRLERRNLERLRAFVAFVTGEPIPETR
jgi:hypothetical protein